MSYVLHIKSTFINRYLSAIVHEVFTRIGRNPHAAPVLIAGWRVFPSAFWINRRVDAGTEWVQWQVTQESETQWTTQMRFLQCSCELCTKQQTAVVTSFSRVTKTQNKSKPTINNSIHLTTTKSNINFKMFSVTMRTALVSTGKLHANARWTVKQYDTVILLCNTPDSVCIPYHWREFMQLFLQWKKQ
jgi:hypothetical protein